MFDDPARIDLGLDSRSISFENPSGRRGQGGLAAGGRKGAPSRTIGSGETLTLADIKGPGRLRHVWLTLPPADPVQMRAVVIEVFYDGAAHPSISVPCLDFFGLPHGRPVAYASALTSVAEGRGFNAYYPMPFREHLRLQITNAGAAPIAFFYQLDYTLEAWTPDAGYLHVSFRRENPTTQGRDFVIAEGFRGPGRFLGCAVGVRVLHDDMSWYGEGEFKFYRDGDGDHPTICGTGLEDYVGSAWGMGPHVSPFAGVPLNLVATSRRPQVLGPVPDFVSFYRWHLPDPLIFHASFRATIQQIGALAVARGQESEIEDLTKRYTLAGNGWATDIEGAPFSAFTLAERRDDYCAAAFVYCRTAQPVARVDVPSALADIGRREYERPPRR
ncbi:MAG: glycoside hydrolase family 172 protein [Vicinamibacterales bacterium]